LLGIKFCFEYKTAKLQWTAKDVDTKDKLVLMYISGTTNPPTEKAGVNQKQ
jgi:acyl-coenzyme A synthetase/AMP-(fatty) acid ligase